MRDDHLARRMFFVGCLALPFLWFVNVLHFRKQVYGSIPFLDSDENEISNENTSAPAPTPDLPRIGSAEDDDESSEASEHAIEIELKKWVHRSTFGAFIGGIIFITWVITFQVNKDKFGPSWFIMSEDEGDVTGW